MAAADKPSTLPADPKAEAKEERKEDRAQSKEERKANKDKLRADPTNTKVDENTGEVLPADELSEEDAEEAAALAVDEHPFGILGGDLELEDLPEPKPKVDLFPNHAPRAVPVKVKDLIEAGQKRVDARLEQLNDEREARKEAREEAKANAKEQAESRKEARIEHRAEHKAEHKEPVNK